MSVGIMDADISEYTLVPFNLECMKISAYYKRQNQLVTLCPEFTPERHEKFFYRKDYDNGIFPSNFNRMTNVQYGGYAFSGEGVYSPLPPEIERMQPDTSLYYKMESAFKQGVNFAEKRKIFNNLMTGEHCRLSLDGKNIWSDYPRQFKMLPTARNLIFHDYDLNSINGSYEEVVKILRRARTDGWATRVGMKFPVQINDGQSLINWSSIRSNSTFYSIRYNGVIEDDPFMEWVGRCREKAIYTQMEYYVTDPKYKENYFTQILLPKLLHQVLISRTYRVFFLLKYDEGYFSDPRWEKVIDLLNYYHNCLAGIPTTNYLRIIAENTVFDFAKACPEKPHWRYGGKAMTKQQIRDTFDFVREHNYSLFKEFYECNAMKLGGVV